jgi:ferredoxin
MSVNVKFEPEDRSGIIAENTYLWDAAKRLGVRLPAECEGRGDCDTCAVTVIEGATLLSSLTDAERERLSAERLAAGERLACQTRIERAGDLVLRPVPVTERKETADEAIKDFRKEFREMPLEKKVAALMEFEAITIYQTLSAITSVPSLIGDKVMNLMASRGRTLHERERKSRRPREHAQSRTTSGENKSST